MRTLNEVVPAWKGREISIGGGENCIRRPFVLVGQRVRLRRALEALATIERR